MPAPERWRLLLEKALQVVDKPRCVRLWAPAGAARRRHGSDVPFRTPRQSRRRSFFDDAQALSFLSPRRNDTAARLSQDYLEQANSLKFALPEGDIDFILAGRVTAEDSHGVIEISGRTVSLEPVAEILAKKSLYRAGSFKPRDMFDLAVALDRDSKGAATALQATRTAKGLLRRRLEDLRGLADERIIAEIDVTETGRLYIPGMIERVIAALENHP